MPLSSMHAPTPLHDQILFIFASLYLCVPYKERGCRALAGKSWSQQQRVNQIETFINNTFTNIFRPLETMLVIAVPTLIGEFNGLKVLFSTKINCMQST